MCTGQAAERPPKIPVATASPTATPLTMPAVTVAMLAAEDVQVAASVASPNVPSLICVSSRVSADCPCAMESRGSGRQRSASTTGGPMVTVTGAEETGTPVKASVALATRVMVLPAAAPAFAETENVEPSVGREPETLEGAAMVPDPVAESESCVTTAPAVFQALATAVSDPPPCSVARLSGKVMATCRAVMLMGAEVTLAALTAVPALASLPVAPVVKVKGPSDCAVKGMWKTVLLPPASVEAPPEGDPTCVAVALAEMPASCTCVAEASPLLRSATATSMASPRCASEGEAITEATVRLAGFCTVAGPAAAAGAVTAVPALASVPEAEAVKERLPLPATE